ncbi:AAA family ATPase [Streptomyces sp. NPDC048623]|uniref:AAA family ATPase n=1 Tax=Streptomyces sp. NPDC048623 TaxID=3155761 RepID=UPI00343C3A13
MSEVMDDDMSGDLLELIGALRTRVAALVAARSADDPTAGDPMRGLYVTGETALRIATQAPPAGAEAGSTPAGRSDPAGADDPAEAAGAAGVDRAAGAYLSAGPDGADGSDSAAGSSDQPASSGPPVPPVPPGSPSAPGVPGALGSSSALAAPAPPSPLVSPEGGTGRLAALVRAFGLSVLDAHLLLTALAPDVDRGFEALYGYLNDDVGRRRATVALALDLAATGPADPAARARFHPAAPLRAGGLLEVEDEDRPLPGRALRVPERVIAHLLGDDTRLDARLGGSGVELLPPTGAGTGAEPVPGGPLGTLAARVAAAGPVTVHLRERVPGAATEAVVAALRAAGRPVLRHRPEGVDAEAARVLIREARLRGAAVVVEPLPPEPGPLVRVLAAVGGTTVVLAGGDALDPAWLPTAELVALEAPGDVRSSAALWHRELGEPTGEAVGTAGPAGTAGATGPAEPARTAGATGTAGAAGATGATGPARTTGATEPARTTGAAGTAETAETAGPAGPAGATGATGPAEPARTAGATGPAGAEHARPAHRADRPARTGPADQATHPTDPGEPRTGRPASTDPCGHPTSTNPVGHPASTAPGTRAPQDHPSTTAFRGDFDLDEAVAPYRLGGDQIRRAARAARALAAFEGGGLTREHVQRGARLVSAPLLDSRARRVRPAVGFADIVLPEEPLGLLRELTGRARHRDRVLGEWRLRTGGGRGRGVVALFAGESGTGKTLGAEVVAGELGLDLYVVDLSSVVDKYVGETEKNLERIFAEVDRTDCVLLFDEADAVFGKRSEVRSSHDRYANLESAYLLQRLEAFDGIAVLTTNLRANIDEAFTRRLDLVVDFPFPDAEQRVALWHSCLAGVPRAEGLDEDIARCAKEFELAGGAIRSAAVTAGYLAAARGTGPDAAVMGEDLLAGARREYRKAGRLVTDATAPWSP